MATHGFPLVLPGQPAGMCALNNWETYSNDVAAVTQHNADVEEDADNASEEEIPAQPTTLCYSYPLPQVRLTWARPLHLPRGAVYRDLCKAVREVQDQPGVRIYHNKDRESWTMDAAGCGLNVFEEWRSEFESLAAIYFSENEIAALPAWLGENVLLWGNKTEMNVTLDLTDNLIADLPLAIMEYNAPYLTLKFAGNPCAETLDWSGRGLEQLPQRMRESGRFDNGGFKSSLKKFNVSGNRLDEGVFRELSGGGYGEIVDLDLRWWIYTNRARVWLSC